MQKSAIKLTKQQLDFAVNTEYPLIKREVIDKVCQLFDSAGRELDDEFRRTFPQAAAQPWKITKGENYLLMPYAVLDYPKIPGPDFDLLMRTFFWWGHYFSFNLIVRTAHLELPDMVDLAGCYILDDENIWLNDIGDPGYKPAGQLSKTELLNAAGKSGYLRLVKTMPVADYERIAEEMNTYTGWLQALGFGQKKEPLSGS